CPRGSWTYTARWEPPALLAEQRLGAQPNPAHHITASAAVLGQGKAEPLPSCQAADPSSQPGAGHQLRTWFVHSLVGSVLGYTEIHTSDAFSFFSGRQGWKSIPGHPQLLQHCTALSNTAEMHLNLIKFSPHCSCQKLIPKGSQIQFTCARLEGNCRVRGELQ
uniref:Uncharacterized protein n=1 Tax=Serinus canaria TaxID=9135 RepID=A0A8C9NNV3_SERCA